ncbi:MAG: c-type cytochrome, partial [Armatimonadetes bacterium]|nr:c-type cytochrome [Armatimonadota bacterium]
RNASTLLNRAYSKEQFWDARSPTLEDQAIAPLANPEEMTTAPDEASAHRTCVARLAAVPGYRRWFQRVFGNPAPNIRRVGLALATFERTLFSGNSAYDRYEAGDRTALNESQLRGKALFFGRTSCFACHEGPNFTNEIPANTGVNQQDGPSRDRGQFEVTRYEWLTGFFKPPSLREAARTAPYMHDGSLQSLEEVVEHYNKGGGKNLHLDDRLIKLHLTAQEKRDLVAFLEALNGEGWQHVRPPAPEELPQ